MARIAVIGAGVMGGRYIDWILGGEAAGLALAAVCTRNPETAARLRERGIPAEADSAALYRHAFDAVLIAAPHKEHLRLAGEAFRHGRHVLCEKPAGVTAGEAGEMHRLAAAAGCSLGFLFQNRALPVWRRIKALLAEGALGEVRRARFYSTRYFRTAHYHRSGSWRSSWTGEGGGALLNQGQHPLDLWCWLFGLPQSVYAEIPFGKYNAFSVDDEAQLLLRYPRMSGSFYLSTGEAPPEEYLEIAGTKMRARVEGDRIRLWDYGDLPAYHRESGCVDAAGLTVREEILQLPEQRSPYLLLLENFARHLEGGEALIAGEGAPALQLSGAAYLSAWEGRPVELPFDDARYDEWLQQRRREEADG